MTTTQNISKLKVEIIQSITDYKRYLS